jgi:hypothetical protein
MKAPEDSVEWCAARADFLLAFSESEVVAATKETHRKILQKHTHYSYTQWGLPNPKRKARSLI